MKTIRGSSVLSSCRGASSMLRSRLPQPGRGRRVALRLPPRAIGPRAGQVMAALAAGIRLAADPPAAAASSTRVAPGRPATEEPRPCALRRAGASGRPNAPPPARLWSKFSLKVSRIFPGMPHRGHAARFVGISGTLPIGALGGDPAAPDPTPRCLGFAHGARQARRRHPGGVVIPPGARSGQPCAAVMACGARRHARQLARARLRPVGRSNTYRSGAVTSTHHAYENPRIRIFCFGPKL
jgi:hypothetical protein